MKENKIKNAILGGGILLILLLLVVGISYAYFGVNVDSSKSKPTNIEAVTEAMGIASLKGLISELHLNLSASDMSEENIGDYYATDGDDNYVRDEESGTKKISEVEIADGPETLKYACSVDIELSKSELDNDIISVLQDGDMFINIEGEEQDLKDFFNTNPVTKKISFKIKGNNKKEISLYIKLINKETEQDYLAGKALGIDITTKNLQCEVDTSISAGDYVIAQQPAGLTETPGKGDLQYRYVGTQDQSSSINNYVCFGADNCAGDETNNHMYRIIGITGEGQLKIQKNSAISTAQWWTDYTTDKSWADSKIYTSLKESDFYESTTYVSQGMKDKIETGHAWNTGDVKSYNDGTTVYDAEKTTHSHTGAVGLAYLSDYYFAYNDGGTQNCTNGSYCKSWMVPSSTSLWKNKSYEWTMSRYGYYSDYGYYAAWFVGSNGYAGWDTLNSTSAVRPVFYLQSTATITGGEGTLTKPYIIN